MAGEIKKVQFSEGLNVDTPADIPFTADDFTGIMPTAKGGTGVNGSAVFPTSGTVATTADITAAFEGKKFKDPVVVATASNITLSGEQTIDGVLTSSSRVLVKSQSAPAENGIYVSAAGAWSRASDANTWDELTSAIVSVERGTSYSDTGWFCIANSGGTLGTTAIVWEQKFGPGAIDLTSDVTGLLPIGNGGTNASNAADAYDNLSPASAKGDIVSHNGTGAEVLAVGANGKVLGANSAQASGLEWVDAATLPIDLTTDVTGTLGVPKGGTGQVTANAALNALLPSQAANSGKVLSTNGTDTSWAASSIVVTTTRGDLIKRGITADERLAIGAANTLLKSDGTDPSWSQINSTSFFTTGAEVAQGAPGVVKEAGKLKGTNTSDSAPAGYVGEEKTNAVIGGTWHTSGQWGDLTTVTLSGGHWIVWGSVNWLGSGTTLSGSVLDLEIGIGTVTGNNATGVSLGRTGSISYLQSMSGSGQLTLVTPPVNVYSDGSNLYLPTTNLIGSQVLRLKGLTATYSGTTPQFTCQLTAMRVR